MAITFGPVPSRRLGRSLGIDLVPFKSCTYNCIYCQLGATSRTTVRRRRFHRIEAILSAVRESLNDQPAPDVLTFSGSGEPTLHLDLDRMIMEMKSAFNLPVAVLTNGALLSRPSVRKELLTADMVLPSMDAWSEEMFQLINRPHPRINVWDVLKGLVTFRDSFEGELWLEIFFVRGINDSENDLQGLLHWVEKIRPDRIQINTVTRPPAEDWVQPVDRERLEQIRTALGSKGEMIVPFRFQAETTRMRGLEARILELIKRRPVCPQDLITAMGVKQGDALGLLEHMARCHGWHRTAFQGRTFFTATSDGAIRRADLEPEDIG